MSVNRLEGRLFSESGCLFMVITTDESKATARVSCRLDGHQQIIEMPLCEVTRRVGSSSRLILDNLNGPESARRILSKDDGWYFSSREGLNGPYAEGDEAASALGRYILSMQTDTPPREEPSASTGPVPRRQPPGRRTSDAGEGIRAAT